MNKFVKPINLHLTISIFIVANIALIYGFRPDLWFDVKVLTTDELNIYKAIMGVYIAFSSLWFVGITKEKFWQTATISNFLFMFGLAFGRIVSIIFDGIPSTIFLLGTIGELTLGFYAFYQFKKSKVKVDF
jgi:hypothetical protein